LAYVIVFLIVTRRQKCREGNKSYYFTKFHLFLVHSNMHKNSRLFNNHQIVVIELLNF